MPLSEKDLNSITTLIRNEMSKKQDPVPTAALSTEQLAILSQQIFTLLLPTIKELITTIIDQTNTRTTAPPPQNVNNWGAPPKTGLPGFEMQRMAIYADKVENPNIYSKKKLSAVIERLPEAADEEEDKQAIEEKVKAVVDSDEFPEELNKKFKVNRHGKKRAADKWQRPTKVHFEDAEAATAFIRAYRLIHPPTKGQPSPFARRDLSMAELALQNAQKKWVAENNKDAQKEERFTYRNLQIFRSFPKSR